MHFAKSFSSQISFINTTFAGMARPQRSVVKKNIVNFGSKMRQKLPVSTNNVVRDEKKTSVKAGSPWRTRGKSKQDEVMKGMKMEENTIDEKKDKKKKEDDKQKSEVKVVENEEKPKRGKVDNEEKTIGKILVKKRERREDRTIEKVKKRNVNKPDNEKIADKKSKNKAVEKAEQTIPVNGVNNEKKEEGKKKTAKRRRTANHISVNNYFVYITACTMSLVFSFPSVHSRRVYSYSHSSSIATWSPSTRSE